MPSPCLKPSRIPLSTSVKSITDPPAASCSRTISSPLTLQAVMSLVNGNAAAQPGSSSSFRPCAVASPFSVTTQVLLRSVVESSHWPIMSFFKVEASCARSSDPQASSARSAASALTKRPVISGSLPGFPAPASAAACPQTRLSDCRPPTYPLHSGLPPQPSPYFPPHPRFPLSQTHPAPPVLS